MKLKIVFSVLFVILFFSSCSQHPMEAKSGYIDIPSPVEKIQWGMLQSDCLDALGLTEDQVTVQATEGNTVTVVLPEQMDVFGFSAQILLEFYGEVKDVELGLISMRFDFGKDVDLEKLKENISAALGEFGYIKQRAVGIGQIKGGRTGGYPGGVFSGTARSAG